jgi:hypothetical protein
LDVPEQVVLGRAGHGANRSDTRWYREDFQRGMADKDAISFQPFGGTQY